MAPEPNDQFLFYSNASETQILKYIENFLLLSSWGITIDDLAAEINFPNIPGPLDHRSLRLHFYKATNHFYYLTATGITLDRLKENLLHHLMQFPKLSDKILGFAVKSENLLIEYTNGKISHQVDVESTSSESIQHRFDNLNLDTHQCSLEKVFTIHHHFAIANLKNMNELLKWLKQKITTDANESIEISGWGTLYQSQSCYELRWDLQFEPDWLELSRWVNRLVPAIDVFTEELKEEFFEIKKNFQNKVPLDLYLDNETIIWKGQTFLSLSIYLN